MLSLRPQRLRCDLAADAEALSLELLLVSRELGGKRYPISPDIYIYIYISIYIYRYIYMYMYMYIYIYIYPFKGISVEPYSYRLLKGVEGTSSPHALLSNSKVKVCERQLFWIQAPGIRVLGLGLRVEGLGV